MKRLVKMLVTGVSALSIVTSCQEQSESNFVDVDKDLPSYILDKSNKEGEKNDDKIDDYYHIFVPQFADSNGDGIGDLQGIIDKLDYLRKKGDPYGLGSLGVNGIFLSPIHKATSYHKYDVIDLESIDPQFGTMEQFETLINQAHQRGLKVIIDTVLNHSSIDNELFKKAIEGLKTSNAHDENGRPSKELVEKYPEIDYFRFIYRGSSFSDYSNRIYETNVGDWLFEGFSQTMPDWNLDNSKVRQIHSNYLKFWSEKGVDGFRLDAVKSYYGEEAVDLNKNFEYINYIESEAKKFNPDVYIVAEGPWSFAECREYVKNTNIDSYFDFQTSVNSLPSHYSFPFNAIRNGKFNSEKFETLYGYNEEESEINSTHIDCYFNSNHDVGRINNQFVSQGNYLLDKMKFFYSLMACFSGNYFTYYGDEIGLMGVKQGSDDRYCRAPFNWGDSYTPKELVQGQNDNQKKYSGSYLDQVNDPDSSFNFFRRFYAFRHMNPAIQAGKVVEVKSLTDRVVQIEKKYLDKTVYLFVNTSPEENYSLKQGELKLVDCLSATTYSYLEDGNIVLSPLSVTYIEQ